MQQQSGKHVSKGDSTARQQLVATCAAFFILGVTFATWATRIPAIRDIALLTPATLGYVLLGKGVGTIVIMPVVVAAIHRFGAKLTALAFGVITITVLMPMVLSPNWEVLTVVLLISGAAASGYNIAINALGSKIEMTTGRSHMSTIHSWFGVGNFAGAIIGTGMGSLQISALYHFMGVTFGLILLMGLLYKYLPDDVPDKSIPTRIFKIPHGALIWLGVICFLAASVEDSITNWVALFFTDYLDATQGFAPIGYVAYAGSMLAMRWVGDRLKPRFGAQKLISVGSLVAASGIILAVISSNIILACIGFVMAGAGVALTFPMVFSAAGKEGPAALASVATIGFLGGMASQPIMGYLVENFKLSGGFVFIVLCMLTIAITSWKAKLLEQ